MKPFLSTPFNVLYLAKRMMNYKHPFDKPATGNKMSKWRSITLFLTLPIVVGASTVILLEHFDHDDCHHLHARPKFIPYEHLRIRTKKYPWGDGNKSFIHNPRVNALPDGYEDEQE